MIVNNIVMFWPGTKVVASQTMPGCGVWHSWLLAALIHLVGSSNLQDVFFCFPSGPNHACNPAQIMQRVCGSISCRGCWVGTKPLWPDSHIVLNSGHGCGNKCLVLCGADMKTASHPAMRMIFLGTSWKWYCQCGHMSCPCMFVEFSHKHLQKIFLKTDKISLSRNVYMVEHRPPPFVWTMRAQPPKGSLTFRLCRFGFGLPVWGWCGSLFSTPQER